MAKFYDLKGTKPKVEENTDGSAVSGFGSLFNRWFGNGVQFFWKGILFFMIFVWVWVICQIWMIKYVNIFYTYREFLSICQSLICLHISLKNTSFLNLLNNIYEISISDSIHACQIQHDCNNNRCTWISTCLCGQ